jgi:hypothetical protein
VIDPNGKTRAQQGQFPANSGMSARHSTLWFNKKKGLSFIGVDPPPGRR